MNKPRILTVAEVDTIMESRALDDDDLDSLCRMARAMAVTQERPRGECPTAWRVDDTGREPPCWTVRLSAQTERSESYQDSYVLVEAIEQATEDGP